MIVAETPFEKSLEKIMFKDKEMNKLKGLIALFKNGKCSAKDLKGHIIGARNCFIKEIMGFIPYHYKQLKKKDEIKQFTTNTNDEVLLKELEEKNILIEKVGIKVRDIRAKLQNKMSS